MEKTSSSTPLTGLTEDEVNARFEQGLYNKQLQSRTKSISQIVRDNTFTLFNILNVILAIFVISVGSYKNALFINIVVINTVIGIIQEIRAKRTIDRLSLISEPHVRVLRDGAERSVTVENIVIDDIMRLSSGNQIPADSTVVSGEIEVNESLLTGESDAIIKKPGDPLLSGSFVIAGTAEARVIHVGEDNYAARLTAQVQKLKKPNSEIMRALNFIMKVIGITIIPIGLIMFCQQFFFQDQPLSASVVSTVAALIGMIPEGLVLLTSVALAVGVVRLSHYKTLVQELYCIETLARVDVLCLDKTGTITEGTMEVKSIDIIDHHQNPVHALRALMSVLQDDNATACALRESFSGSAPDWIPEKQIPFSSQRKWSGVYFKNEGSYIIGAPEFILKDRYVQYKDRIEAHAAEGSRVLLLAHSPENFKDAQSLPENLNAIALVLLGDKIRAEARDTLEFFACQGVDIKVISGDNPVTVSEVACRAGLMNGNRYIDASVLQTEEQIREAADRYTVFGRVTPEQKQILIRSLKEAGHTVAMTGDGVNDVLALREADCSIAMASGSDAARQVAQLVLLNSNFANMTRVLMEGRRVINNISRAASLFLVKTIFSFLLSLVVIVSSSSYPFVPIQLTLISALAVGIPSFFLALEPNKNRLSGSFLEKVLRRALPGALTIVLICITLLFIGHLLNFTSLEVSTLSCILTGVAALMVLYGVCQPLNPMRTLLFWSMTILFIGLLVSMPEFFHLIPLYPPRMELLLILFPMLFLIYPVMLLMEKLVLKTEEFLIRKGLLKLQNH